MRLRCALAKLLSVGPAIHLVNLIPSSASLADASVPLVQAILTRASLPLETIALAVCILDSLNARFARTWRLSCPLLPGLQTLTPSSKRHTLPPAFLERPQKQQLHIDSVSPELIILAALVIAVKFTEDPQCPAEFYCRTWAKGLWSHDQLNFTERCIMEALDYRIMPLCEDECITDAMVDMQLAARQAQSVLSAPATPGDRTPGEDEFVPAHSRAKTLSPGMATGMRFSTTRVDTPAAASRVTPLALTSSVDYFGDAEQ
jgi:hypothetical protein